jgi:hypothetical protein
MGAASYTSSDHALSIEGPEKITEKKYHSIII